MSIVKNQIGRWKNIGMGRLEDAGTKKWQTRRYGYMDKGKARRAQGRGLKKKMKTEE
jgi:hypothetical protein